MLAIGVTLAGGPATARAHPQPSPDRNNRYLKLTPMADRVRLAYTIYLGDTPGAHARRRLDRDGDGQLTDAEGAAIGRELAATIAPAVELTVDDRPAAIEWSPPDVGLGTPSVNAGALSVDVIGWVCTGDGAHHRLALHDRVRVDSPGETEVRLEDGPGIAFPDGERRLGGEPMRDLIVTWRGDEERLGRGLDVGYTVDVATALKLTDHRCSGGGRAAASHRRPWAYAAAALGGAVLAAGALYVTRRRSSSKT